MPDNYTSFAPTQFQGREWSPLNALQASEEERQLRKAQVHALEQMSLGNQQKGAELRRYEGLTPGMVDKSQLEGAQSRAQMPYAEDYALGQRGDARVRQAAGDVAMGTSQREIQQKNAEALTKTFEATAQKLDYESATSPMLSAATWRETYLSLPQEVQRLLPQAYDPSIPEKLRKMSEAVKNNYAHQRDLAKVQEQGANTEKVAGIQGQTARDVANITQTGRVDAASIRSSGARAKVENVIADLLDKFATEGTLSPKEMQTLQMAQQIAYNMRAAGVANTQDPNAIKDRIMFPDKPTPGRGVPQPVMPQDENLRAQVEAKGEKYEPEKYEYRIGPNGNVQKKAK
jgi:hypothetical protein